MRKARIKADSAEAEYQRALAQAQANQRAAQARQDFDRERQQKKAPGRAVLDAANPIDWDDTPTFFQAAEVAHGHLLRYKQIWYADGYSLGDLLYSLPLAPGQKKLISVIDWERREENARREDTAFGESLSASLSRDRDLGEVVRGALTESTRGGSKATTSGLGAGGGAAANGSYQGINFGALIGVSGGYGEGSSSAWQDSAKSVSASSMQNLRDRTMQSASALRSLRSTVVNTATQGEALRSTTEVIANHNHCHAMTMQYFEVLRHFKLEQKLADVRECLFVPLPMSAFDADKVLRWRDEIEPFVKRSGFGGAFDATRRVATNWEDSDLPGEEYGDEFVSSISGDLAVTITVPTPPLPVKPKPSEDPADAASKVAEALLPTEGLLGALLAVATGGASLIAGLATQAAIGAAKEVAKGARGLAQELYELDPQDRYARFQHDVVPGVVEGFINSLELSARVGGRRVSIAGADFTLVSQYEPGRPLEVALNANMSSQLRRNEIDQLVISSSQPLPEGCRAILNGASLRYRTGSFTHQLVTDGRINDDIEPARVTTSINVLLSQISLVTIQPAGAATIHVPLDAWEQRNPRKEDRRLANELISHLNDNLEYYHHAIWWAMDPNRRYLLLDGFRAPNSNGRSLASVVDNELVGIVGNSLVLPVAAGVHLDPRFRPAEKNAAIDLMAHYLPTIPAPPTRISLPTRGVFAEAVMGNCNSCEQIDDTRFWRWEESPIDEPPQIEPVSMASRRADPASGSPSAMPAPIVSIQNAPAAPDPTGIAGVLDQLGKQTFADITGLAGNQTNAAAAYKQALDTAFKFGKEASTLAQQAAMTKSIDRTMGAIDKAEASGGISPETAKQLRSDALRQLVGSPPGGSSSGGNANQPTAGTSPLADAGADAVRAGSNVTATTTYPDGTRASVTQSNPVVEESVDFEVPGTKRFFRQSSPDTCWAAVAAMMRAWKYASPATATVKSEIAAIPGPFAGYLAADMALDIASKNALVRQLGLNADRAVLSSATPQTYLRLMGDYGPLWITVDGDQTAEVSPHAKFVYGLIGDMTAEGTMLKVVDPNNGRESQVRFSDFVAEYEELARAGRDGQVTRFATKIDGEGASPATHFSSLTDIVRPASMVLSANAAVLLGPRPGGAYRFEHNGKSGTTQSSGWTGVTEIDPQGLTVTKLRFPIEHEMNGMTMTMPFTVIEDLDWSNARVSFAGTTYPLPLTDSYILATAQDNANIVSSKASAVFPLDAVITTYSLVLFGYWVDTTTGAVTRLDLTGAPVEELEPWLRGQGRSDSRVAVLALFELTANDEKDDYSPKMGAPIGPGFVARAYPLLSIWSGRDADNTAADLDMTRPAVSAMGGMANGGWIGASYYADYEDRLLTVWDDLHPTMRTLLSAADNGASLLLPLLPPLALARGLTLKAMIIALKLLPTVRWNSLFAHYKLATSLPLTKVVDRSVGVRTNPTDRMEKRDKAAALAPTATTKVAGQLAFDNIHMAPSMIYNGAPASMAPICHHDCLHLHWRWSTLYSDKPVHGWSNGKAYSKAGAPMIPENQILTVGNTGMTFHYQPEARGVAAGAWQIFMHHGFGYVTGLSPIGYTLPLLEMTATDTSWPSWEALYYHNRFWETGGANRAADTPRLDETKFGPLEAL